MTRLQKITLVLTFWSTVNNESREAVWKELMNNPEASGSEDELMQVIAMSINNVDEKFLNWGALRPFFEAMQQVTVQ